MWKHDTNHADEAIALLSEFAIHALVFRAMREVHQDGLHDFWTRSMNAHAITAINSWCMVLGSEGRKNTDDNPTHWKNWIDQSDLSDAINSYKDFQQTKHAISDDELCRIWKGMVDFRNHYTAHYQSKKLGPMPYLDEGMAVAIGFDDWYRGWAGHASKPLSEIIEIYRPGFDFLARTVKKTISASTIPPYPL